MRDAHGPASLCIVRSHPDNHGPAAGLSADGPRPHFSERFQNVARRSKGTRATTDMPQLSFASVTGAEALADARKNSAGCIEATGEKWVRHTDSFRPDRAGRGQNLENYSRPTVMYSVAASCLRSGSSHVVLRAIPFRRFASAAGSSAGSLTEIVSHEVRNS